MQVQVSQRLRAKCSAFLRSPRGVRQFLLSPVDDEGLADYAASRDQHDRRRGSRKRRVRGQRSGSPHGRHGDGARGHRGRPAIRDRCQPQPESAHPLVPRLVVDVELQLVHPELARRHGDVAADDTALCVRLPQQQDQVHLPRPGHLAHAPPTRRLQSATATTATAHPNADASTTTTTISTTAAAAATPSTTASSTIQGVQSKLGRRFREVQR